MRVAIAGKNAASPDCWKLFAATVTVVDAIDEPLPSKSCSVAAASVLPRFTRPTFVRYDAFEASAVSYARRPIHIIWNKLNTVYWNQLLTQSPSWLSSWCDAIQRRIVCHINPFSSRYVVENKRSVAFFQEDQFATLLTDAERQLVRRILPWSRKLEVGKRVELDGASHDLRDLVWQRQVDFVLKEPYDIRGDGVTIGRAVDRRTWERNVQRGFDEGHVVQRFVRALTYPILELGSHATVIPMTISLDSFVLGGRFAGFGSKASLNDKVNLFQGGRKVAVRIGARA